MQIESAIKTAKGNGKTVEIFVNHNSHTGRSNYWGNVIYSDYPQLNFSETFDSIDRAEKWFETWSLLTNKI